MPGHLFSSNRFEQPTRKCRDTSSRSAGFLDARAVEENRRVAVKTSRVIYYVNWRPRGAHKFMLKAEMVSGGDDSFCFLVSNRAIFFFSSFFSIDY